MGELFAGWRLVPARLRASWRLLAVTGVGVVVAAALLAATPLYSSALSDLGLQFRLGQALAGSRLNAVAVEGLLLGDSADLARRRAVDAAFEARVGWLGPEVLVEERSERLLLDFAVPAAGGAGGERIPRQPWNAFLFWLSGYEQHVAVTEGRLPGTADGTPEVVLLDGFQRHAALGDRITLEFPPFDDCATVPRSADPEVARQEQPCRPTATVSRVVTATVVGFVRPDAPRDPRWEVFAGTFETPEQPFLPHADLSPDAMGGFSPDQVRALAGEGSMPLLTAEGQFFGPFARVAPDLQTRHRVGVLADVGALALGDVDRGIAAVRELRADLADRLGVFAAFQFPLGGALEQFRNTQTFQQTPLLIILLQVVGIVVYYVAVVSSMLVERQAEEISVYRSRGASTAQLLGLYLMEGVVLAAAAALVAPPLAGLAVSALGFTPTFNSLTGGGALPVRVGPSAYLLAAGGATLALLALLLPAFAVARRGVIDAKREQARPPSRSVLQRYYLDLAAVALAGFLLWQLGQRGSVFDPGSVGGWSSDPLLLLSPFVFTLAVAALLLRFYPPLLRWTVGTLLIGGGTSAALGLRRAARAPAAYARLILLLVMAIAVGTFASSYGSTVERSLGDRVRYATGVDVRGALQDSQRASAPARLADVAALDGVGSAALAHRGTLRTATNVEMELLALDPQAATSMLWWRADFAEEPLDQLMRRLQSAVPSGGGVQLHDDTERLRVSLLSSQPRERRLLWARYRDARGFYMNQRVTALDFEDWRAVDVPLPPGGDAPLTFLGFRITEASNVSVAAAGDLYLDDLKEVRTGGEELLIDDFEREQARFGWRMFATRSTGESFELSDEQSVSATRSARWSWPVGIAPGARFLLMDDPNLPLAAIVNPAAAAHLGVGAGGVGQVLFGETLVPVRVQAVVELFPTLEPDRPFVVVNFEHMRAVAEAVDVPSLRWQNELWVGSHASLSDQRALLDVLRSPDSPIPLMQETRHQPGELAVVRADPMLRASGGGILIAAFSAVLGLAMLGFVVTLVLGARARTTEFAVLRAVGSSPLQVLRSMALEWGAVLTIGVAVGVLLGRRVAGVMLSFLDVTEAGTRVVPPFTLETDWLTLAVGVGALVTVAALGLALSWGATVRRKATLELRLTR